MDNQKIPTSVGAIVLAIVAITSGVFVWVYEKNQGTIETDLAIQTTIKKDLKTDSSKEGVDTAQQFPEMSQEEKARLTTLTKDWQTYRDTEYGYEFKYPKSFSVERNKYESDIPEVSIINNKTCTLPFGLNCNVTIRTLSPEDERIKDTENDKSNSTTRFEKNGYNITYRLSDGVTAIIQTNKKSYFIVSLPNPESMISVLQGIYFTFKEL